jgi:hypothetical protein
LITLTTEAGWAQIDEYVWNEHLWKNEGRVSLECRSLRATKFFRIGTSRQTPRFAGLGLARRLPLGNLQDEVMAQLFAAAQFLQLAQAAGAQLGQKRQEIQLARLQLLVRVDQ